MEFTFQKTTALILGLGSPLFLVAAFLPYSRVFAEADTEKNVDHLTGSIWNVCNTYGNCPGISILRIQGYYRRQVVPPGCTTDVCRSLTVVLASPEKNH